MVRPTSSVWNHFIEYKYGNKKTVKCKYCGKKYLSPNATKMAKHIEKCTRKPILLSVPVYSRTEDEDDKSSVIVGCQEAICDEESLNMNRSFSSDLETVPTASCSTSKEESITRPIFKSFFDSVSKSESERLDSLFAKAVYASNIPLSFTDNTYWQQFFRQIRPAYNVPTCNELSNTLLDKEYEDINHYVKGEIEKADFVTIITDGWSNLRNEGIVIFVVATPTPIFYKAVETRGNRHTAEYMASEMTKVIEEIGVEKISGLVTDNASNMKAAWKIIKENYPFIFTIGCAAHGLNLLLSDIYKIETFQIIISKAKGLVKYVKNKQALLSVFTAKQKMKRGSAASTLKLPAETRCCSTLIMFESLLNGKESLQETVLIDDLNIDKEIRQLTLDNDIFWASIHSLVNVLNPICNGISKIESDSATLSDVPLVFFNISKSFGSLLSTPLQTHEEEAIKNLVKECQEMFCQPIHYAAYLLDPRYIENDLEGDKFRNAIDFISSLSINEPIPNVLADFAQYKSRNSVYSNNSVWESAKLVTPFILYFIFLCVRLFFTIKCLNPKIVL